ncbi:unnamed protein product [Euphydryas editha]|uniref:Uncharacterized protein n=1 Tax=Euphydryas editha TaxID=104508 RepID=A0AAU9TRL1_EUPED|nr:unnamed protein product [Euphydryas editha]
MARSVSEVNVPCWSLWKPLRFVQEFTMKDVYYDNNMHEDLKDMTSNIDIKEETQTDNEVDLGIRQRGQQTDRPRKKSQNITHMIDNCKQVLDDLVKAMVPLLGHTIERSRYCKMYYRTTCAMRKIDADCASQDIMKLQGGSAG